MFVFLLFWLCVWDVSSLDLPYADLLSVLVTQPHGLAERNFAVRITAAFSRNKLFLSWQEAEIKIWASHPVCGMESAQTLLNFVL